MKGFRISAFWQAIIVVVVSYLLFEYAFPPVMPKSLMVQYMVITIIGVLLYYSFDDERWAEFKAPVLATLREDRLTVVRWIFLIGIPAIVAYTAYGMVKPSIEAPVELRQVHPAPPSTLRVFNNSYDLTKLENPLRNEVLALLKSDKAAAMARYDEVVEAGREVYYQNCFYCHGDRLDGEGHYAQGFNPLPANFQDVGTIAQLQEAFLFWRVTTGGPGLPKEGTPWNSAMPVWHEMLDEEQVWQVITFLYDYVDQVPRMWDGEMSKVVTGMKDSISFERRNQMSVDLYNHRCAICHGEQGAGDGAAAEFLYPMPRDFTLALFKYKTSPGSALPRDEDLFDTIKFGLAGTGMPGWGELLSDERIRSLIPVIKRFDITAAWAPEEAEDEDFDEDGRYIKDDLSISTDIEPVEGRIAFSAESAAKGKERFEEICGECHGKEGRGNITSGKQLADDWENRLWPRDLTKPWTWRVTQAAGDEEQSRDETIKRIYERLSIGIPGTPMPAHRATEEGNEDPVSLEDRWHIANYVYTLREKSVAPVDGAIVRATPVEGDLPGDVNDPRWNDVPATTLHLVPNIIKADRLFTPLNDSVTVRAVFNNEEMAFLLEIDDRTDSRPGLEYTESIKDDNLESFPDAVAIEFPLQESYATKPVVVKPLYRHGDAKRPTSIWYWNAGSVEPAQSAATVVFDATGPDKKLAPRPDASGVSASGAWADGQLRVIMKRKRVAENGDINFSAGEFIPIAFANWDGSNGEAGSRHTLTTWNWLLLPPEPRPLMTYGLPTGVGVLIFVGGIVVVRGQREKGTAV